MTKGDYAQVSNVVRELFDEELRSLAMAARARIRELVPHATEEIRRGWNLLGFNAPHYFAFITQREGQVTIGFERGVLLDDPDKLLYGTGTQVRWVTIRRRADLARPALAALILQAAEPPQRSTSR